MTYENFLNRLAADLKTDFSALYPQELGDAEINIRYIPKLQGASYLGLTFRPAGGRTEASLDLRSLHRKVEDGCSYAGILKQVEEQLLRLPGMMPDPDPTVLGSYEIMRKTLILQLIPQKGNEEMLSSLPHRTLEDLAAVARFDLRSLGYPESFILVTRSMLEKYHVTEKQLFEDALQASLLSRPATLKKLREILEETVGSLAGETADAPEVYVASVEGCFSGASVLLYPGFLEDTAKALGRSFFVLPSSVHELLFIPDDGSMEPECLKRMVREVNRSEVAPEDRLSDSVYYCSDRGKVLKKIA